MNRLLHGDVEGLGQNDCGTNDNAVGIDNGYAKLFNGRLQKFGQPTLLWVSKELPMEGLGVNIALLTGIGKNSATKEIIHEQLGKWRAGTF